MKTKILTILAAVIAASVLLTACGAPTQVAVHPVQEAVAENLLPAVGAEVLDYAGSIAPLPTEAVSSSVPTEPAPTAPAPTEPAPTVPVPTEPTVLTRDEVKAIVFAELKLNEAEAARLEIELDDGKYEIEFHIGNKEYDIEVDARTGKILRVEREQEKPAPTKPTAPAEPAPTEPAPTEPAPTVPTVLTRDEVKAIVFSELKLNEAEAARLEIELDDGKYEIEFHIGNMEYDVEVNARTGKILKVEKDKENEEPSPSAEAEKTDSILSPEEVKQLIFAKLGITEDQALRLEIELDDGKYELEFRVGRLEYECEVSARTGKILQIEREDED